MGSLQQFAFGVAIIIVAAVLFRAAGLKDVEFGTMAQWVSGLGSVTAIALSLHTANKAAANAKLTAESQAKNAKEARYKEAASVVAIALLRLRRTEKAVEGAGWDADEQALKLARRMLDADHLMVRSIKLVALDPQAAHAIGLLDGIIGSALDNITELLEAVPQSNAIRQVAFDRVMANFATLLEGGPLIEKELGEATLRECGR